MPHPGDIAEAASIRYRTHLAAIYCPLALQQGAPHPHACIEIACACWQPFGESEFALVLRSHIQLPETSYPLFDSLPASIVDTGKLSQLQLEGVLYACAKHQELLPSGQSKLHSLESLTRT